MPSGTLADGTRLSLTSDLVARRKERRKTKGRKKIKEDLCEHVVLTLRGRPAAGRAAALAGLVPPRPDAAERWSSTAPASRRTG